MATTPPSISHFSKLAHRIQTEIQTDPKEGAESGYALEGRHFRLAQKIDLEKGTSHATTYANMALSTQMAKIDALARQVFALQLESKEPSLTLRPIMTITPEVQDTLNQALAVLGLEAYEPQDTVEDKHALPEDYKEIQQHYLESPEVKALEDLSDLPSEIKAANLSSAVQEEVAKTVAYVHSFFAPLAAEGKGSFDRDALEAIEHAFGLMGLKVRDADFTTAEDIFRDGIVANMISENSERWDVLFDLCDFKFVDYIDEIFNKHLQRREGCVEGSADGEYVPYKDRFFDYEGAKEAYEQNKGEMSQLDEAVYLYLLKLSEQKHGISEEALNVVDLHYHLDAEDKNMEKSWYPKMIAPIKNFHELYLDLKDNISQSFFGSKKVTLLKPNSTETVSVPKDEKAQRAQILNLVEQLVTDYIKHFTTGEEFDIDACKQHITTKYVGKPFAGKLETYLDTLVQFSPSTRAEDLIEDIKFHSLKTRVSIEKDILSHRESRTTRVTPL